MSLQLHIVTPVKAAFSGAATSVIVPGLEGQFGVLPQHDCFLALAKAGIATVSTAAGEQRFVIGRGFAEVTTANAGGGWSTLVTLLTEVCEPVSAIDKDKARKELADAEAALAAAESGTERWRIAGARVELARVRLDA